MRVVRLLAWAFLQQYLLQGLIHRRLSAIPTRPLARDSAVGGTLALLHLPDPVLVAVRLVAGRT